MQVAEPVHKPFAILAWQQAGNVAVAELISIDVLVLPLVVPWRYKLSVLKKKKGGRCKDAGHETKLSSTWLILQARSSGVPAFASLNLDPGHNPKNYHSLQDFDLSQAATLGTLSMNRTDVFHNRHRGSRFGVKVCPSWPHVATKAGRHGSTKKVFCFSQVTRVAKLTATSMKVSET